MPALVINGAQWGDEGKGKLVDCLTSTADWVVRFQGGHNAGHTLVVAGKTTKLSLIPCGILQSRPRCLIAAGVVVRPEKLLSEIEALEEVGIKISSDKLSLDAESQLLLGFHAAIDKASEGHLGENKIGTTGRGIGPAYEDRASRIGIRAAELLDLKTLKEKIKDLVERKQKYLTHVLNSDEQLHFQEIWEEIEKAAPRLTPLLANGSEILNDAITKGQKVVFEGAQATLLDSTFGTFPFVTSASTLAGAVCTGAGVGPRKLDYILGVVKAYCTRVGEGPFPTEAKDPVAASIREKGREFGTVTGRPRRCGWLDIIALKRATRLNGYDSIAITKLDVLTGIEKIRLALGYTLDGKQLSDMPAMASLLGKVEVQYQDFDGWDQQLVTCKKFSDLPKNAQNYLKAIEDFSSSKISLISVGAERDEIILNCDHKVLMDFWHTKSFN